MHLPGTDSIGAQCNLLAASTLKTLSKEPNALEESFTTDPEDTDMGDHEETYLDSSFQITQDDTTTK